MRAAVAAYDGGDSDEALRLIQQTLAKEPTHWKALYGGTQIMLDAERLGFAYQFAKRLIEIDPDKSDSWNMMGRVVQEMGEYETAGTLFEMASEKNPSDFHASNNVGLCYLNQAELDKAEYWLSRALALPVSEDMKKPAYDNMAMLKLARGEWREGWDLYRHSLGKKNRRDFQYGNEPVWDGSDVESLMIFGEQGIGDEIMFASCIPNVVNVENIYIDCDHRLEGLFRRSFPWCHVKGARFRKFKEPMDFPRLDARAPVGLLPHFYRHSDRDFPGVPYLVACEARRRAVRAALDYLPGKKVGLAWTGGRPATRGEHRSMGLDQLEPLLNMDGVSWISLEYKGGDPCDERIHHWPWYTQTQDYDDTAALVAELDAVVSVTTSVVQLSGGLGVPTAVFVNSQPTWSWANSVPWHGSVNLFHQTDGWPISEVMEWLGP